MSNQKLLPFEKNNYYYGKLLTVRDFQLEQQYGTEKRELINRYIIGSGIVDGLRVEQVGGRGIRVTPGLAIDKTGTEIVVSRDFLQTDIKELGGYPLEGDNGKTVYVMLGYKEVTREPIPVMSNASCCQEVCEANRIVESFEVGLSTNPPAPAQSLCGLLNESTELFKSAKLRLERIVPRFVRPSDCFEVIIRLTALQPFTENDKIKVQVYEQFPENLSPLKREVIRFAPGAAQAGTSWEMSYTLRAGAQLGATFIVGTFHIEEEGTGGGYEGPESAVDIVDNETIQNKLADLAVQLQTTETELEERVILATLTLDASGLITKISSADRRYVYNNMLLSKLVACIDAQAAKLSPHALSHQAGGDDEINVNDLSGVLKDAQKVHVYFNGDDHVKAKYINFGGGLSVDPIEGDAVYVSVEGGTAAPHAATHQAGGSDQLNVEGLPGVLEEPQKVHVYYDGDNHVTVKKVNFGAGLSVRTLSEDTAYISVEGAAAGAHAASHQPGGIDELNVEGLKGVLEEGQKISIGGSGTDGKTFHALARHVSFYGDGVTINKDGESAFVHINPQGGTNYEVVTGTVTFNDVGGNTPYRSDFIDVDARGKAITLLVEHDGVVYSPGLGHIRAWAQILKGTNGLTILGEHGVEMKQSWKVHYFIFPATVNLGEVGSHPDLS